MKHQVLATIVAATSVVAAHGALAHGGDVTVMHACAHRVAGNVRFVAADESCRPPEVAVHLPLQAGAGAGGPRGVQLFESEGSFTVPPGVTSVLVELWGGGGAAGLVMGPGPANGGGNGGGGAYLRTVVAVEPGQEVAIRIGQGGTAACGFPGEAGGDTTLGILAMAGGGGGGTLDGVHGAGGQPGAGGITYPGQDGASGGRAARGSFAPPATATPPLGSAPGNGGISFPPAAAMVCSERDVAFGQGRSGQIVIQW